MRRVTADLGHCLDDENAGHHLVSREVALKEPFVRGDVLDADAALSLFELEHAVDKQERVAVGDDLLDLVCFQHQRAFFPV